MNFFDRLVEKMDKGELSFVTAVSKIIPLLVPLIPAYVSYQHVISELQFHPFFAFAYGAVVEGLGYAAIYKAVQFWEENRHYTKATNKLPIWLPITIYVLYMIVILSVNVMLDAVRGVEMHKVWATGLISVLSLPAGLLLAISALHTERTIQKNTEREERKANRVRLANERTNHRTPNKKRTNKKRTNSGANEQRTKIVNYVRSVQSTKHRTPGPTEIANAVGVAKSYASETLQLMSNGDEQ
jgi:uncharacterized membrane protein YidH (DUF202 family)